MIHKELCKLDEITGRISDKLDALEKKLKGNIDTLKIIYTIVMLHSDEEGNDSEIDKPSLISQ